jgi:hypothetical protein
MEYEDQYPEEDSRYLEVTEEYDHLSRKADFARGRLLRQIRDERIFGRWGSFTNCAKGRLKTEKRRAYNLIKGACIFDLLEDRDCQLPNSERQIRSLSRLRDDDLKVLAWTRACQQKQPGSPPDSNDVARQVRRLLPATPDQESDEAYRAFRRLLESAQSEYRKAHTMLEEGELEGFLAACDRKSTKQKKQLIATMAKLEAALHADMLNMEDMAEEEMAKGCLPDLLCFRKCGLLIQWQSA